MTFLRKLLSFIKCRFLGYVPLNKVVSVEIDKTVTSTKDAAWGSPLVLEDKKMNKPIDTRSGGPTDPDLLGTGEVIITQTKDKQEITP